MTDEELINECLNGSGRAQKALFDKFSGKMMGVCMRYANDEDEAQDMLQEGFIKVFHHLHKFKHEGSFEGWIRRTMVNTALDTIRRNKRMLHSVDISEATYLASRDPSVLGNLGARDLLELIRKMPVGYRTVFNMFAIEGYSHQEIAHELGVTESTSKTQYKKARNYLMNLLPEREQL